MAFQIYFDGRLINPSGKNMQLIRIANTMAKMMALMWLNGLLLSGWNLVNEGLVGGVEEKKEDGGKEKHRPWGFVVVLLCIHKILWGNLIIIEMSSYSGGN